MRATNSMKDVQVFGTVKQAAENEVDDCVRILLRQTTGASPKTIVGTLSFINNTNWEMATVPIEE